MVNDEVDWAQRVDLLGVSSHPFDSVPHSSKIYNCGYTSEILKDDSGRFEWNFNLLFGKCLPVENVFDVFGFDFELVTVSNSALQQHPNAVWQLF
jgi:hypothetical protein